LRVNPQHPAEEEKMAKKEVEFKGNLEQKQLVSYLEELIKSIKSGTVVVQHGAEHVALTPQDVMELEVEAKQKDNKEKLSLEISWKKSVAAAEAPETFKISSEAPEVPKTEEPPQA